MPILFSLLSAAFAAVLDVPVQGSITLPDGTPANGSLAATLVLYDAPSGGGVLAATTTTVVAVAGAFTAALPVDEDQLGAAASGWLEVVIGGQASARVPVGAAPFAINARRLDGHAASEFVRWEQGYEAGTGLALDGAAFSVVPADLTGIGSARVDGAQTLDDALSDLSAGLATKVDTAGFTWSALDRSGAPPWVDGLAAGDGLSLSGGTLSLAKSTAQASALLIPSGGWTRVATASNEVFEGEIELVWTGIASPTCCHHGTLRFSVGKRHDYGHAYEDRFELHEVWFHNAWRPARVRVVKRGSSYDINILANQDGTGALSVTVRDAVNLTPVTPVAQGTHDGLEQEYDLGTSTRWTRAARVGQLGVGVSTPQETVDIRGTTASNDVLYERTGRINANTAWTTLFTANNANAQAMGIIEVFGIYSTPSAYTARTTVMVRGNKTFSILSQQGESQAYAALDFRWLGNDFQIRTNDINIYYGLKVQLWSVGASHKWNHTWGTGW